MIEKRIQIVFTEPVLGTSPANQDIFREFVAAKNPNGVNEEEAASLETEEQIEKSSTIFPKEDGHPFFWDYQIKGFFKDAQGMFNRIGKADKLQAHKKIIDGLVFIYPRRIPIVLPADSTIGWCERPLRAGGPQGERVALARSEMIPSGSVIEIRVKLLKDDLGNRLDAWLDYGSDRGLGQWRNSGMGRFAWQDLDAKAS